MEKMPKYSKLEHEKKWLLKKKSLPSLEALDKTKIVDKYFPETKIRLRKMTNLKSGENVYKLCKKYGKLTNTSEPITNIYLNESEYLLLNNLPGYILTKNRYGYPFHDKLYSIDEFTRSMEPFYLLELEIGDGESFEDVELPEFIERDVTEEEGFSGYSLALAATHTSGMYK